MVGIPATYVQATPDLMMGDLLKNMRSSQIFSVCGLPEVSDPQGRAGRDGGPQRYEVELLGLDMFDPTTMEADHRGGDDVPAWFLDTDYNDLCFHVSQAFFPRTSAWDNLKKALKADFEERSGTTWPAPSARRSRPGEHAQIAVKVIDDRGNELLVVKSRWTRRTNDASFEVPQPILNSPFEEPAEHWHLEEGSADRSDAGPAARRLLLPRPAGADGPDEPARRRGDAGTS